MSSYKMMISNIISNNNNHHDHHQQNINNIYPNINPPGSSFNIIKDDELGEFDQALLFYLDDQDHHLAKEQRENCGMNRPHTLNIFPSEPMHVDPSATTSKANAGLASRSGSKRSSEPSMELSNPNNNNNNPEPAKVVKRGGNYRKGPTSSSEQEGRKTPDPKTLRRLAQNREAARKSRLRKKAYVQQLESSRMRLTQLEQEIHKANSQGFHLGGSALLTGGEQNLALAMRNINSDAALFNMEYVRWLEEHHRLMVELRRAVQDQLLENDLQHYVENCLQHYDQLINLKSMIVKSDVFHLFSGMWLTPAERCFMWMGGFRPSQVIKIILNQIEELTEQQMVGICGLQQCTEESEEALNEGLQSLNNSLSQTITSHSLTIPPNMNTYMTQMALAINRLSTLEAFLRQGDNLRHQTLDRLHQILTTHQAAWCFLAIGKYFRRLRAVSSLWLGRPAMNKVVLK